MEGDNSVAVEIPNTPRRGVWIGVAVALGCMGGIGGMKGMGGGKGGRGRAAETVVEMAVDA